MESEMVNMKDSWSSSSAYEAFMGRWSRRLAPSFLDWLSPEPGLRWLDVGCGTGALTTAILRKADPARIVGCDPAEAFIEHARRTVDSPLAAFEIAGIDNLPHIETGFDRIVSGLVMNFLPDPDAALEAMKARLGSDGRIAVYVWDYAEGMEFLRIFWEEAAAADPGSATSNQGERFPICREGALGQAFSRAGLLNIRDGAVTIRTAFSDFSDYWGPFELGTGSAPAYVARLDSQQRERLIARLRARLTPGSDGPIELSARAWAAAGELPAGPGN
jgi:SAM-dependent methyltransferase